MIVNSTRILVFCTTTHTRVGSIIKIPHIIATFATFAT